MLEPSAVVRSWNREARAAAKKVISAQGRRLKKGERHALERVNALSEKLNDYVEKEVSRLLKNGKIPAIIGGDHSVPYGAFKAAGRFYPSFGLLHFDAHHDMRDSYEGFQFSHASILRNALDGVPSVKKLVQVGIRDFCEEELAYCADRKSRVRVFYDHDLAKRKFAGEPFERIASEIAAALPQKVWITFDIDALSPLHCPNTGTPVPGGLDFNEAVHIFRALVKSGREIIGFDLVEVAPDPSGKNEWDANVGARMLYKMSAWALTSRRAELSKVSPENL